MFILLFLLWSFEEKIKKSIKNLIKLFYSTYVNKIIINKNYKIKIF